MEKFSDYAKRMMGESFDNMSESDSADTINEARDFSKYMKDGKLQDVNLDTDENELYLYVTNSGDLYRRMIDPINKNLLQKKAKGVYDSALAPQAFYNAVEQGAKAYQKDFGHKFKTSEKEAVAAQMAYEFEDDNGFNK